jgi:hypothetical protein
MTWSLNELEAEARKAIRGAGLSWGLAEDGSKAARWLAAHGVDPLPALSDVLDRHDRRTNIAATFTLEAGRAHADAPICPIALGVAVCDNADLLEANAILAGPVARPLLLVPFVATAARLLKRSLQLDVNGMQAVLNERGDPSCDVSMLDVSNAPELRCAVASGQPSPSQVRPASTHGIATDPASWRRVAVHVRRTYVPASERSRREGAGAGLIDND